MSALSAPSVRAGLFPPPSVPLRFTDGDRYEWQGAGNWLRVAGEWEPIVGEGDPDPVTDAEVHRALRAAVKLWDTRQRFVPAMPSRVSGRTLLVLPKLQGAAQYVHDHTLDQLVPLRDLVGAYSEDAALDIPGVLTEREAAGVISGIDAEHEGVHLRYDDSAGRVYVRYLREGDIGPMGEQVGWPPHAVCLHVFVLAATPVEA
ncbi:hypothetical protein [Streptomyces microflavus]|uniref:hypothetical protein n=1 Tax=Streptomyces microflavus TaxID=1919 RepID=UPI00364FC54B